MGRYYQELKCLLALVLLVISSWSGNSYGHVYGARVDIATWQVEPSPLECRLSQHVPNFGKAVFLTRAGSPMTFFLNPIRKVKKKGQAVIRSIPPQWRFDTKERFIAKVSVIPGSTPFTTSDDVASRLLAELQLGMFPSISHEGWYPRHHMDIEVSSVNFSAAYEDYISCTAGLFPKNFEQLERSTVLFETNKWNVKAEYRDHFEMLYQYTQLDPDVAGIIVDGHTDSRGGRDYNWDLSRLRAEEVEKLLYDVGFPEDFVQVRYHGEQHPVVKNNNKHNRQRNRRVTLRLTKEQLAKP